MRLSWRTRKVMDIPDEIKIPEYPFPQGLRLKPGRVWAGIDPTKTNHLLRLTNICVWYDGTMRPGRGHNGDCKWDFDGQIWWHL